MKKLSLFSASDTQKIQFLWLNKSPEGNGAEALTTEEQKEKEAKDLEAQIAGSLQEFQALLNEDLVEVIQINETLDIPRMTESLNVRIDMFWDSIQTKYPKVAGTFKEKYQKEVEASMNNIREKLMEDKVYFEQKVNTILSNKSLNNDQKREQLADLSAPGQLATYLQTATYKNQNPSIDADNKIVAFLNNKVSRLHQNILRTAVVRLTLDLIDNKTQDAEFAVEATERQKSKGHTPFRALTTAMHVDRQTFGNRKQRQEIAAQMTGASVDFRDFMDQKDKEGLKFDSMYMIVGGEKLFLNQHELNNFVLKNVYFDNATRKLYAQTENGCEGNLVYGKFELKPFESDAPSYNKETTTKGAGVDMRANLENAKTNTNTTNRKMIDGEYVAGSINSRALDAEQATHDITTQMYDILEQVMKGRTFEGGVVGLVRSLFKDRRLKKMIKAAEKKNDGLDIEKAFEETVLPKMQSMENQFRQLLSKFDESDKYDESQHLKVQNNNPDYNEAQADTGAVKLTKYKNWAKKDMSVILGSVALSGLTSIIQGNPISLAVAIPLTWIRTGVGRRLALAPNVDTMAQSIAQESYTTMVQDALAEQTANTQTAKDVMKDPEVMIGRANTQRLQRNQVALMHIVGQLDANIGSLQSNIEQKDQQDLLRKKGKEVFTDADGEKHKRKWERGQLDKMQKNSYRGLEVFFNADKRDVKKLIKESQDLSADSEMKDGESVHEYNARLLEINAKISDNIAKARDIMAKEHEEDYGVRIEQDTGKVLKIKLGGRGKNQVYAVRQSGSDAFSLQIGRGQGNSLYKNRESQKNTSDRFKMSFVNIENGLITNMDQRIDNKEGTYYINLLNGLNDNLQDTEKFEENLMTIRRLGQYKNTKQARKKYNLMEQYKENKDAYIGMSKKEKQAMKIDDKNIEASNRLAGMRETQRKATIREAFADIQKEQIFVSALANQGDEVQNARYAFIDQFYQASKNAQTSFEFVHNATSQFPAPESVQTALAQYFETFQEADDVENMKQALSTLNENSDFKAWTKALALGFQGGTVENPNGWAEYLGKINNEQAAKYIGSKVINTFEQPYVAGVPAFGPSFEASILDNPNLTTTQDKRNALVEHLTINRDTEGNALVTRVLSYLSNFQKLNLNITADEFLQSVKYNSYFEGTDNFANGSNEAYGNGRSETNTQDISGMRKVIVPLPEQIFSYMDNDGKIVTVKTDVNIALNANCTNPMIEFPTGQYQLIEKNPNGQTVQFLPESTVRTWKRMPITAVVAKFKDVLQTKDITQSQNKDHVLAGIDYNLIDENTLFGKQAQQILDAIKDSTDPIDITLQKLKDSNNGSGIPQNVYDYVEALLNGVKLPSVTTEVKKGAIKAVGGILPIEVNDDK